MGPDREDDDEPSADLVRGVALAESGRVAEASTALNRFATEHSDDLEAQWAEDYAAAIEQGAKGERCALLIGAGTFRNLPRSSFLSGPRNDALALADHVVHRLGFPRGNVTTLVDKDATRAKILGALDQLADRTGPESTVLVAFSGHVTGETADDVYLVTYDVEQDPDPDRGFIHGISSQELADRLAQSAGGTRLLILDCGMKPTFRERMIVQRDWVVIAPLDGSLDVVIDGTPHGALVKALLDSWPEDANFTCGELVDAAGSWLRKHDIDVAPTVIGDRAAAAASPWFRGTRLWWLARNRSTSDSQRMRSLRGPAV